MTTKFSVRPAPRKKPWICKRSPPCLVPDPIPLKVLVTYWVKQIVGPQAPTEQTGSFWLPNVIGTWEFIGDDPTPGADFHIRWVYIPAQKLAWATSTYATPPHSALGEWPLRPARLPPSLRYLGWTREGPFTSATGRLMVTS